MIERKTENIPATTRQIQTCIICDWCKKRTPNPRDWSTEGSFCHYHDITIRVEKGSRYPDGGFGERTKVDLCPECWTKLLDFLKVQGVVPEIEDIDY